MQTLTGYNSYNSSNKQKHDIKSMAFSYIDCRKSGGKFYNNIKEDIAEIKIIKSKNTFARLAADILIYAAGEKIIHSIFPKSSFKIIGEFNNDIFLYHITPKKNLNRIKKNGLTSSKKFVFLTDNVEYLLNDNFLNWKATNLNQDTDFCILKIDAKSLRMRHKIYLIDREHELITKKVEPEFILFE